MHIINIISEVMICLQKISGGGAHTYVYYYYIVPQNMYMVNRWRVYGPDVKIPKKRTIYCYYNIIKHIRALGAPDPHPLGDRKFGGSAAELYIIIYELFDV